MDEYGDDNAGPRLAKVLRRNQQVSTGSRLGFVGHIDNDRPGLFARNKGMAPGTGPLASVGIHVSADRSEAHTSELQSLMRISYAVFCLKKKTHTIRKIGTNSSVLHNSEKRPSDTDVYKLQKERRRSTQHSEEPPSPIAPVHQ